MTGRGKKKGEIMAPFVKDVVNREKLGSFKG
jgi:hypothetical protein